MRICCRRFWLPRSALLLALLLAAASLAATSPHPPPLVSPCAKSPALATPKGAYERANRGWDEETLKKNERAIRRVRLQRKCAPSKNARAHVRRVIAEARAEFKAAKREQNAYGDIDPPGEAYLAGLRACESGGDYQAVDPSGTYRGAYQFDFGTWASVGGSGDPAAASPDEQDYRAALLWRARGSQPWPICG